MVKIRETFPYEHCERCPDCRLDVNQEMVFGDGGIVTRELTVGCKHEWLCRQLSERLAAQNEQKPMQKL